MNYNINFKLEEGNIVFTVKADVLEFMDHLAKRTNTTLDDTVMAAVKPFLKEVKYNKLLQGDANEPERKD